MSTTSSSDPQISGAGAPDGAPTMTKGGRGKRALISLSHAIVLILSLLLIVYISYDTFEGKPFLTNSSYMNFQFWVCMVFLADFFIELIFAVDKKSYIKARWFFFLISIPYLNIVGNMRLTLSPDVLFYLRFVPLVRGCYSLAMVIGYVSRNRALSILSQYAALLVALVYMLSLIFYYQEHGINSNVKDFWDAIYWSAMNMTTVGCYFSAVTPVGKIISVILPTAGMLILPLFTVFVTSKVKEFDDRRLLLERLLVKEDDDKAIKAEVAADVAADEAADAAKEDKKSQTSAN